MRTGTTAAILFLASSTLFAQADDEQVQRRHKATTPTLDKARVRGDARSARNGRQRSVGVGNGVGTGGGTKTSCVSTSAPLCPSKSTKLKE
jgi:hypothetical protein